jgi:hypothetical protein
MKWASINSTPTLASPAGGFGQRLELGLGFWSSGSRFLFRSQGWGLMGLGPDVLSSPAGAGYWGLVNGDCVSGRRFVLIWELGSKF